MGVGYASDIKENPAEYALKESINSLKRIKEDILKAKMPEEVKPKPNWDDFEELNEKDITIIDNNPKAKEPKAKKIELNNPAMAS